ncbi:hypothetical protein ACIOGZ_28300 [Kitasatospora sp. NPDC088160]|uniref:hypothetical protein n=1 Tax=Kitasatospora sp. NPDC088160 TaxID=3364072 RepID=UPI0037F9C35A
MLIPFLQLAATTTLLAWMAAAGFRQRPHGQWLSWTMFCYATFTIVPVLRGTRSVRTEDVDIYTVLPPGSFVVSPAQLATVLDHLQATGFEQLEGQVRVLDRHGDEHTLTVRNGRVDR